MRTGVATPWIALAACALTALGAVLLLLLNLGTPTPRAMVFGPKGLEVAFPVAALGFPVVGALIAAKHPENRFGWSYLALGFAAEALVFTQEYGLYALATAPGRLPAGAIVLWVTTWIWAPVSALLPLTIAIFPDGRLIGPRWHFIVWCVVIGAPMQAVADAFRPGIDLGSVALANPLGLGAPAGVSDWLYSVGTLFWAAATFGATAELIARYRRAPPTVRQQIKWFMYASAMSAIVFVCAGFTYGTELGESFAAVAALSVIALPLGTAIAIFRYRLYDIDLLIKRTVVYGATSAAIAATFFIGIVALQPLLRSLTSGSELPVAASTLVSFALFQPVRRRVQGAVDRRFDRSRYDAGRTLDTFADRVRDEVDLDELRGELLGAVRQTMAPAHASLWLRERAP